MNARVLPFAPLPVPVPPPDRARMLDDIAALRRIDPDLPAARAAYVAGFMAGFMQAALPAKSR